MCGRGRRITSNLSLRPPGGTVYPTVLEDALHWQIPDLLPEKTQVLRVELSTALRRTQVIRLRTACDHVQVVLRVNVPLPLLSDA